MTTCITTFSRDGFDLYGSKMIDSWLKYWPEDCKLIVYHEGFNIPQADKRLLKLDLNQCCPDLVAFKNKSSLLLEKTGNKKEKNRILKTVKWCHKVYAITDCLKNTVDDYVVFLDGDTYTINKIPIDFARRLVEDNLFAVHFEKLRDGLHFETGLIVFNSKHNKINWFTETYTSGYNNLDIYDMKKTWDGYWLAYLYEKYRLPVKNLSENRSGVFNHPLVKKLLGHDVGTSKYIQAGYNEFIGKKSSNNIV